MTTKAKLTGNPAVEVVMAGLPKERTMTEQQLHYLAVAMMGFAGHPQPTSDNALVVLRELVASETFRNAGAVAAAPKPCETGKHCERQARDLGACVAGMCFPPAPVGGVADYGFRCYSCGKEWEGTAPIADCPNCGTTNEHCAANPRGEGGTDGR
jgi:hypothetical protein